MKRQEKLEFSAPDDGGLTVVTWQFLNQREKKSLYSRKFMI